MSYRFLELESTPSIRAAHEANGSLTMWQGLETDRAFERFTPAEVEFIAARDSFYIATVSETGWPYIQHRGGPPGFLKVLDETTLGFADLRGNRQYISLGNVAANDRVAVILMDYPNRKRLKLLGYIAVRDLSVDPELAARLALPAYKARVERGFVLRLATFDWNCPQHILPRFSAVELEPVLAPLQARVETLEAENAALRARVADQREKS